MGSKTVKRYAITTKRNVGSTDIAEYITSWDQSLVQSYREGEWDTPIVELDITFNFPEPELPTTPGSLIRATVDDEKDSVLLALSDDEDSEPWYAITAPHAGDYYSADDFSNAKVIFDAATTE